METAGPRESSSGRRNGAIALGAALLVMLAGLVASGVRKYEPPPAELQRKDLDSQALAYGAARFVEHGHQDRPGAVAISGDGRWGLSGGEDGQVLLWDLDATRLAGRWNGHSDGVRALAFSRDGRLAASAGCDREIIVWEIPSGRRVARLEGHGNWINALQFLPDGRLVSGSFDRTVRLWDIRAGREAARWAALPQGVTALAVDRAGGQLVAAGLGKVYRWDLRTGQPLPSIQAGQGWMWTVSFSEDGERIICGGTVGSAGIWQLPEGKLLQELRQEEDVEQAFFLGAGRVLCHSDSLAVRIWRLADGVEVARTPRTGQVTAVSVAVDEARSRLLLADWDGNVRLFDLPK